MLFLMVLLQVLVLGVVLYLVCYDVQNWIGELMVSQIIFDVVIGDLLFDMKWSFFSMLFIQVFGMGWDMGCFIVILCSDIKVGVFLCIVLLASSQVSVFDIIYVDGNDSGNYLNYL